jgi:hypothetical protein
LNLICLTRNKNKKRIIYAKTNKTSIRSEKFKDPRIRKFSIVWKMIKEKGNEGFVCNFHDLLFHIFLDQVSTKGK